MATASIDFLEKLIGFPTVSVRDVETRNSLEVFNALMTGGGGIGGRLFRRHIRGSAEGETQ